MNDDHLIDRLTALCKRFAGDPLTGRHAVAQKAGLSEQYLYQILTGKPMANGNKRSLGKNARAKITRAFPDWLVSTEQFSERLRVEEPYTKYQARQSNIRPLVQVVCDLAELISDDGLRELAGFARCLTGTHPLIKAKHA